MVGGRVDSKHQERHYAGEQDCHRLNKKTRKIQPQSEMLARTITTHVLRSLSFGHHPQHPSCPTDDVLDDG